MAGRLRKLVEYNFPAAKLIIVYQSVTSAFDPNLANHLLLLPPYAFANLRAHAKAYKLEEQKDAFPNHG